MTKSYRLFRLLLLLVMCENAYATSPNKTIDDYYTPDYLRFENYTYKPYISTVQLYPESAELSFPIIAFNSGERLQLSFDDLDADLKNYNYTVVHCDANWKPTQWNYSEYITGFHDEVISEYVYSANSIQSYTHYTLLFPTEGLKITKSGNYVLKVFQDNDEQNCVLTRRFMLCDKKVEIAGTAKAATIISDRNSKQEIDFTINNPQFEMNDPYQSLKVTLLQNHRFDNAITGLKPTFTKPGQLVYDVDEGNVFTAGNEFRFFEDKQFRAVNEKIAKYVFDENKQNNIYLLPDESRSFKRYSTQRDINGNYLIRTITGANAAVEADYAYVHFYLPVNEPLKNADVYVFGALSNWSYLPDFKMEYDSSVSAYKAAPYLKQGYYNYEYVVVPQSKLLPDESTFEGSHYETENDYFILVYYQTFGTYYDQLVGFKRINSAGR